MARRERVCNDPSASALPASRRGRPVTARRNVRVSTWVPEEVLDRVIAQAHRSGKSMSRLLRDLIMGIFPPN